MKRLAIIALLILSCITWYSIPTFGKRVENAKEGDIIFQISGSRQSSAIAWATKSQWTHCGIIIEKPDGLYVLEAIGKVSLTPIDKWISRGRAGKYKIKTVQEEPIKISYSKYLGQPYDLQFKFDNNKMYCSELVYLIYKNQFNIELAKPRKVEEYNLIGLTELSDKRGISKEQLVVAPSDLL